MSLKQESAAKDGDSAKKWRSALAKGMATSNEGCAMARDRKKLNSGVRVRSFSETIELVKFKLANFFEIKS